MSALIKMPKYDKLNKLFALTLHLHTQYCFPPLITAPIENIF